MRHFRLNICLLMAGIIAFTAASTVSICRGRMAVGILLAIGMLACIWALTRLIRRLLRMMSTFVSSLKMNDTTVRIEGGGDAELSAMIKAMNRIATLYRDNMQALETRKLYYDRILRIMTHEMRNAITPVISIADDMERNPEAYSGQQLRECAALILSQGKGIKHFLDSYYSLTHLPELKAESVRAGQYFEGVMRLVDSELKNRNLASDTISFIVPADMELQIDTNLMNQVMINLLRNALDAIAGKAGGRVEVVLSISDGRPYLTVSDNGSGIAPEMMENMFQPFFTTKKDGSGVGLCLCRQIVRRHGGDLRIQSHPSRGTTIMLTL